MLSDDLDNHENLLTGLGSQGSNSLLDFLFTSFPLPIIKWILFVTFSIQSICTKEKMLIKLQEVKQFYFTINRNILTLWWDCYSNVLNYSCYWATQTPCRWLWLTKFWLFCQLTDYFAFIHLFSIKFEKYCSLLSLGNIV